MSSMGRMTKRDRAKYRRRAYEAGMLGKPAGSLTLLRRPDPSNHGRPRDLDDKRAA